MPSTGIQNNLQQLIVHIHLFLHKSQQPKISLILCVSRELNENA